MPIKSAYPSASCRAHFLEISLLSRFLPWYLLDLQPYLEVIPIPKPRLHHLSRCRGAEQLIYFTITRHIVLFVLAVQRFVLYTLQPPWQPLRPQLIRLPKRRTPPRRPRSS